MNPYGIAQPAPVDHAAIAHWNTGIAMARADYYRTCTACLRRPAESDRRQCQACRKDKP